MPENEELQEGEGQDVWKRGGEGNEKSKYRKIHRGSDIKTAKNYIKTSVRALE